MLLATRGHKFPQPSKLEYPLKKKKNFLSFPSSALRHISFYLCPFNDPEYLMIQNTSVIILPAGKSTITSTPKHIPTPPKIFLIHKLEIWENTRIFGAAENTRIVLFLNEFTMLHGNRSMYTWLPPALLGPGEKIPPRPLASQPPNTHFHSWFAPGPIKQNLSCWP